MKFKTTHDAYLQALQDVWYFPDVTSAPRGLPVREILNYVFTVTQPTAPMSLLLLEAPEQAVYIGV